MNDPSLTKARECWYLTGPTATGKTEVGVELARRLDAEIISLDSMAVYREMDIGTAKPTVSQRERVAHHLVDLVPPTECFSLSEYRLRALQAIDDIRGRGKQVLFVGGTPLYLKAMLRGLFDGPAANPEFREEVLAEARAVGIESLHERLQLVDPLSAAKLHPHDLRRIIRALEVHSTTGQPISHSQLQFDEGVPAARCRVFMLHWPREVEKERINARVQRMFTAGLVEEVRQLLDTYGSLSQTAQQAVGYREVLAHLQRGISLDHTIAATMTRTRRFAKRQRTWFRSLCECRWIEMSDNRSSDGWAQHLLELAQTP